MGPDSTIADIRRRLALFIFLLLLVALAGTAGYMYLEGWPFADAFYMTVITLSTVGFGEVRPLSPSGRLFTGGLIVAGVAAVAYLFSAISRYVVSGELQGTLRSRRMRQQIDSLTGHYVVCGYGRVGREVVDGLRDKHCRCVVVDQDETIVEHAGSDVLWVIGDASEDETLVQAGIAEAAGLVVAAGDDPTNLFVTVSAHALNPDLVIVARCNEESAGPKLLRAGATHVVSPYTISGRRIATQLLYPALADFLDVVMHSGQLELWMEECCVRHGSTLHGQTFGDADVRHKTGANILAVRRPEDGAILTNPPDDMEFAAGDVLIALGTREQLSSLHQSTGAD